MSNWQGRRILIIGAARQGQALARYLSKAGACVILNDQKSRSELKHLLIKMENTGVRCEFGNHAPSLLSNVDLVSVSGGIPESNPLIVQAKTRGIPLTNDTQVFLEEVKAPVIGITGSAGKTTTTALTGKILQQANKRTRKVWVGGNIGLPLVDKLEKISAEDIIVLEISSFQLEQMSISPHIAAILNITPNHLDRHGTFEAYRAAKTRLIEFQRQDDFCVLNRDDQVAWNLRGKTRAKILGFGFCRGSSREKTTYIERGVIRLESDGVVVPLIPISSIRLRGNHNISNVLAACTISHLAGAKPDAMRQAVENFTGVAHRLEYVREHLGVKWYNDSIATAPERTIAAIHSFSEPIILLLGGRDKNLPWEKLAGLIHQRVDHVVVFGEAAPKINNALGKSRSNTRPYSIFTTITLKEAIKAASEIAQPGHIVLFSPGGTSFDEYRDFEERGEAFKKWVNQLQ